MFSTQNWQLRNGIFASITLSFFITLTACEDPQEIGSEVFAQDIGVLYTDTLTVDASSILLDSVVTSGSNTLLVGSTIDPSLGLVKAASYFHMVPFDTLRSFVDTAGKKNVKFIRFPSKVDSMFIFLPYNSYEGDTNQRQTIKLMQFANSASLEVGKQYYSNSDAPALGNTIIGQLVNTRIRPIKNKNVLSGVGRFDSLRIRITDPAFINFIISQRDSRKDDALVGTEFRRATRGFALTSESTNNAALLGFDAFNTVVRIYYSYKYTYTLRNKANTADSITATVDTTKANFLLPYDSQNQTPVNVRFNKLTTARTGNLAKLAKVTDALPAKQANNEVYIQNSTGLVAKVKFPTLANLKNRQDIAINKAELVIEPNVNPNNFFLPQDLVLVESTNDNRILRTTKDGTGSMGIVSGESSTAVYQSRNNTYTFNITSSLQNVLSGRNKSNGWIISPTVFSTNAQGQRGLASGRNIVNWDANRAVFDVSKIKLRVYYTAVKK
ncbi:MAG: DUF4270 family protein [Arcicella sp.]|nr:DUF4270 family protein [Arcicella sp.]